ncbi:hypothetical protein [Bacillus cereus]|uniref:hypothetical protein n=1 Tax=Bacillus cereus group TaxID=86661 RepID=UPI0023496EB3|nr:hypothetical protein [Bacillus cereus]
MASNADFGCAGGCGSIALGGSPAILSTIVRNGATISLQGGSNILLAPNHTYFVEYNAEFGLPVPNQVVSVSLRLNGRTVPGSQTTSFPSESGNLVTGVSGGAIFNTPASSNPSIMQLFVFPPSGVTGVNFNSANIRISDLSDTESLPITKNNAAVASYGYVNVEFDKPVPFVEDEVNNGSGIIFTSANPTYIELAPHATYFASYNFIECPLEANLPVLVQLTLNDVPLEQSLSVAPPLTDGTSRSGGAGSAVFNTGAGPNYLKLVNKTLKEIKFVAANINIMQIG